jgi:hypothetical protein
MYILIKGQELESHMYLLINQLNYKIYLIRHT